MYGCDDVDERVWRLDSLVDGTVEIIILFVGSRPAEHAPWEDVSLNEHMRTTRPFVVLAQWKLMASNVRGRRTVNMQQMNSCISHSWPGRVCTSINTHPSMPGASTCFWCALHLCQNVRVSSAVFCRQNRI